MSDLHLYSNPSLFISGGPCDLRKTNFPFLTHAFVANTNKNVKSNGVVHGLRSNNKTLTCAVSDVIISSSTAFVVPASGQFRAAGTITKSGDWGTLGTKNAVIICTGSISAVGVTPFAIGNQSSGPGILFSGNSSTNGYTALFNGTNYGTFADIAPTYPITSLTAVVTNDPAGAGNGSVAIHATTSAALTSGTGVVTLDIAQTWPQYANAATDVLITSNASSYLTGIYVCHFTTTPTNLTSGILWMSAPENVGRMFPGFILNV